MLLTAVNSLAHLVHNQHIKQTTPVEQEGEVGRKWMGGFPSDDRGGHIRAQRTPLELGAML